MRVNTGTFEILSGSSGSGTYNLSGGTLNTVTSGPMSISVGATGAGTGYFNMSGGTLNAGSAPHEHSMNVGWGARGEATFSGGTANLSGDFNAGNNANGLITVSGSAMVNSKSVSVGLNAGAANSRLNVTGGTLAVTNGIRVANTSALNISGGTITATGIEIASGSVMTNTGGTLNISAITNNGTLFLDRGNTLAFAGSLSGEGITRIGAGTVLSLESGSAWNGSEIHLDSGAVVRFNGGTGTSTKSLNAFGGTLDVNGQSLPAGSFANFIAHNTGAKLVNSSSSAASIAAGNTIWLLGSSAEIETVGNLEINSVITSALASSVTGITKTGEGTLTLTALNEYTGITTVNQGTLVVVQSTFTATITSTNITVALSNTPSAGNTFAILPGPLQGNYGTPTVNPLSTGQTASFDASTGVLSINQTSNGAAIEDAYPGINATNLASNGLTYLANYAFGGSSVTEAKLPLQDITDPTKLTLVAYVRTNNSSGTLTVTGEKANALNLWDTNNPIPGEPAQDQSDAPSGTEKRIFSTPKSGDRLFLRLKTTLQP
jgi:autotransporter-associated beta strand protein